MVVAHAFNSAYGRRRQVDLYDFEASLIHKMSFRTARVVTKNKETLSRKTKRKEDTDFGG